MAAAAVWRASLIAKLVKAALKCGGLALVGLFLLYAAVKQPHTLKGAVLGFASGIGDAGVAIWHWVGQYF